MGSLKDKWKKPVVSEPIIEKKKTLSEVASIQEVIKEAQVLVEPIVKETVYKLGFNAEKMRRSCGKCGATQIITTPVFDGKEKIGQDHTCNDCKIVHKQRY